jgi:hypothetical protein
MRERLVPSASGRDDPFARHHPAFQHYPDRGGDEAAFTRAQAATERAKTTWA